MKGNWIIDLFSLAHIYKCGFVKLGRFSDRGSMAIDYLKKGEIEKIHMKSLCIQLAMHCPV